MENIAGEGENAGHHYFLLFPQCFYRPSVSGSLKLVIVWYQLKARQCHSLKSHLAGIIFF